ncbi:MAG: CRISPR-associated CARF protein Csa3 [Desulfurococcales archaeon]|nr:CRISPR-associated CARF protein Csa3 [Desulfurococcales archaeon]
MPERLFVATLGFNETYLVNTLHKYGASRGDGVLIITLNPLVGGVRKALNNLNGISQVMGFTMHGVVEVERESPASSIVGIIERVSEVSENHGYKRIIADLTGGPRIAVVSTMTALLLLPPGLSVEVRVQDETGGEGDLRLSIETLRVALRGLGEKGKVLAYIVSNPGSMPGSIAESLGLSPKTVANYITSLKKMGLVIQKGRGRGVYPTEWGIMLSRLGRV